ncbi:MAG TPA: zf-HC2 domain-containing protein [Pyrinomonadaceae bacterium]|nr:zf-HC2 domain-containing protein [Pyrinomonadaceae bacterium]
MIFGKHVGKDLSAYAHGELSVRDSERVAHHLDACARCRAEFEQVKLGVRLAEELPVVSAPATLWDDLEAQLSKTPAHTRRTTDAQTSQVASLSGARRRTVFAPLRTRFALAVLLLAALSGATFLAYRRATRPAWEVARLEGVPLVASRKVGERGRLAVGEWLETDAASRAEVKVANIGAVEIDPGTRVRLLETRLTEHRLELERGRISARIWAPPRLFFVNTPSAVAADLGCAYTLEVDDAGRSLLRVTSGWVALELKDRESVVPAGAACATEPGTGPGTPFFEDASESFLDALARFDFERGAGDALNVVLADARPRDTLTLWHMLPRVEGEERVRVYERLSALAPPPAGVTREGVLQLDASMLESWKDNLQSVWHEESIPGVRRVWRKLWR